MKTENTCPQGWTFGKSHNRESIWCDECSLWEGCGKFHSEIRKSNILLPEYIDEFILNKLIGNGKSELESSLLLSTKHYRDIAKWINEAYSEGKQAGFLEGKEQGRAEGIHEAVLAILEVGKCYGIMDFNVTKEDILAVESILMKGKES